MKLSRHMRVHVGVCDTRPISCILEYIRHSVDTPESYSCVLTLTAGVCAWHRAGWTGCTSCSYPCTASSGGSTWSWAEMLTRAARHVPSPA